jgi:hypothetical protein
MFKSESFQVIEMRYPLEDMLLVTIPALARWDDDIEMKSVHGMSANPRLA